MGLIRCLGKYFGQTIYLGILPPNVNIGILALFAITALGVYGVALAGWSSNSKYPLLGGLRSSAQMISYELALTLSVVGVLLIAGSFNLTEIINDQTSRYGILGWNIFPAIYGLHLLFHCGGGGNESRAVRSAGGGIGTGGGISHGVRQL